MKNIVIALLFTTGLSGCAKLDTPFEFVFYTTNAQLPVLYIFNGNDALGKLPYTETEPAMNLPSLLRLTTQNKTVNLKAVDSKNQVIATIRFDLKPDGQYKSSGGGYVWYDIIQPEPYKIKVNITRPL